MRRLKTVAAMAAASWLLVACAAAPEIPYDKTVAAQVKTIAIITPRFPDGPNVILASTIGRSFGLIGDLIDAAMQANRESQFKSLLERQNFSMADEFLKQLGDDLQAEGYTVVTVPVARDKADFLAQYPAAQADAYLDLVAIGYGYVAAGIKSSLPYRPILAVRARLVKSQDSSVLMQDAVVYNPIGPFDHWVTIAPDKSQQFPDFDALIADPVHAVSGLETAADQTARTIGKLLSPTL